MDRSALFNIVIAIVGLAIGVLATIWAARRWGTRRRELRFAYQSVSLSLFWRPYEAGQRLSILLDDHPVPDPYLLMLVLSNAGPTDVPSRDFEGDILIHVDAKIHGLLEISHDGVDHAERDDGSSVIKVQPRLLRRNESMSIIGVVSGEPRAELVAPIVDTDVVGLSAEPGVLIGGIVTEAVVEVASVFKRMWSLLFGRRR